MKYLGVPISSVSLKNSDWDFVDGRMINKLDAWVGNSSLLVARRFLLMLVCHLFFIILC
jgi:hypothetical protein